MDVFNFGSIKWQIPFTWIGFGVKGKKSRKNAEIPHNAKEVTKYSKEYTKYSKENLLTPNPKAIQILKQRVYSRLRKDRIKYKHKNKERKQNNTRLGKGLALIENNVNNLLFFHHRSTFTTQYQAFSVGFQTLVNFTR